jgi:hypothetical protein
MGLPYFTIGQTPTLCGLGKDMKTEDILAELGFGPAELERKAKQTDARQLKRWDTTGVGIMDVPIGTPPFDPMDPKELEITRRQLWEETVKFYGDTKVATKFLGPLNGDVKTDTRKCEVCGKKFASRRKDNKTCSRRCYQKNYQKAYRRSAA